MIVITVFVSKKKGDKNFQNIKKKNDEENKNQIERKP